MFRIVSLLVLGLVSTASTLAQDRSLAVQEQKKAAAPAPVTRFAQVPLFAVKSEAHAGVVPHMALTPDERYLVTAGFDRTVRIWDAKTGEPRRQYFMPAANPNDANLFGVAVSPDGTQIAVGGWIRAFSREGFSAVFLDLETGRIRRVISGFPLGVNSIAWSPDGQWLALGTDDGPQGALLRIYDRAGKLVSEFRGLPGRVRDLRFRSDGRLAVAVIRFGKSSEMQLYHPQGGQFARVATRALGEYGASRVRWTPDEKRIIVSWNWLLDGDSLGELPFLSGMAHRGYPSGVGPGGFFLAPDQTLFSISYSRHVNRGFLRKWDAANPLGSASYRQVEIPDSRNNNGLVLRDGTFIYSTEFGVLAAFDRNLNPLWRQALSQAEYDANPEALKISESGEWASVPFTEQGKRMELAFNLREPAFAPVQAVGGAWRAPRTSAGGTHMSAWQGTDNPAVNFNGIKLRDGERSLAVAVHASGAGVAIGSNQERLRRVRPDGTVAWETYLLAQVTAVNLIEARDLVVAATANGRLHLVRWTDGAHLVSYLLMPAKRQWLAFTPNGRYEAGIGAEDLAGWAVNRGAGQVAAFFPLSKFRTSLLAPGIARNAFDTARPDSQAPPKPAAGSEPPVIAPAIQIEQILPPVVELLSPSFDVSARDSKLAIRYRASSLSDAPVTAVRARYTSASVQRVTAHAAPGAGGEGAFELELAPEDAEIQVFAESRHGVSTPLTLRVRWAGTPPQPEDARGTLYVLSVGVSDYDRPEYRLGLAAKDAADFSRILERQKGHRYRDVIAKPLLDKHAGRADVLAAFEWLRKQSGPRDTVILFLAGHGINDERGDYFFLPRDANADRLAETGVSFRDIRRTLTSLQGRALMFVDTCHSGNVLGRALKASSNNAAAINEIAGSENGIVVFASSTGSQLSQESPAWGNGAFTKALVEGLRGEADLKKRGRITYKQLDAFVSDRVEELTRGQQTPVTPVLMGVPDFTIAEVIRN